MRRTKIVATVGPATSTPEAMHALLAAGADVVRLNAAHGTAKVHAEQAELARATAAASDRVVGVLIDLPGPKLRTGPIAGDEIELHAAATFVLDTNPADGDETRVSTTVPELAQWVGRGDDIFLADGAIVLEVERVTDDGVVCKVVRGGVLRSRKGMHVPRAEAHVEPFTETDAAALRMATSIKADFVGLSFVRRPEDVLAVRARLPKRGPVPQLVAKIETAVALDHLSGIVAAADAVMVARGDLGIQVPARRVPLIQKEIIRFCNMSGKPVITATQMLESMTESPLPTRAEVNDVANAVLDGTDALMLSEETAVGRYPTEAVRTMHEVAESAESWPRTRTTPEVVGAALDDDVVAWAVAHAAVQAAEDLGVAAIVCPTQGGTTARRVAAFRPSMPIAGIASAAGVLGKLSLAWGVRPTAMHDTDGRAADRRTRAEGRSSEGAGGTMSNDEQVRQAVRAVRRCDMARKGELIAVVSASSGKRAGATDTVRIVRV